MTDHPAFNGPRRRFAALAGLLAATLCAGTAPAAAPPAAAQESAVKTTPTGVRRKSWTV